MSRWLFAAALMALVVAPLTARQPVDTWFVFVDDLHIPFVDTGRIRTMVRVFAAEVLGEGAMYALYAPGPSQVAIDFTSDLARLTAAIKNLTGNALRAQDAVRARPADPEPYEVAYRREHALGSMSRLLEAVTWRDGRPASVLILSSSYFDDQVYRDELHRLLRPLVSADTRVFVLDPRDEEGEIHGRLEQGRVTVTP
jgi:hypothetical protein